MLKSATADISIDLQLGPLIKDLKTHSATLIQVKPAGDDYKTGQAVQFVDCQEVYQLFPDAFALQIDGDSMAPRVNDSDIVILSPTVPACQGQIAVVSLKGQIGVTCKLIRTAQENVHLVPINERYETKIVPALELVWALAVLCHLKF